MNEVYNERAEKKASGGEDFASDGRQAFESLHMNVSKDVRIPR